MNDDNNNNKQVQMTKCKWHNIKYKESLDMTK